MPGTGTHPPSGPNYGQEPWYYDYIGQPGSSLRRTWLIGTVLVVVLVITLLWYYGVFSAVWNRTEHMTGSAPQSQQHIAATPASAKDPSFAKAARAISAPTKPEPIKTARADPLPPAPKVDTKVYCPPEDMLAKTRTARVGSMELDIARDLRHHKLTKEQANEKLAFLHANPDGWNEKTKTSSNYTIDGDRVIVTWDGTIGLRSVAHCSCLAESSITYPPPIPHVFVPNIPVMNNDGCVTVSWRGDVAEHGPIIANSWGYESATGALPMSSNGCNGQWEWRERVYRSWHGLCTDCIPALTYIRENLLRAAKYILSFWVDVDGPQGTVYSLRFGPQIRHMVAHVCVRYKDGFESCAVFIAPNGSSTKDGNVLHWGNKSRIFIPDSMLATNKYCPEE